MAPAAGTDGVGWLLAAYAHACVWRCRRCGGWGLVGVYVRGWVRHCEVQWNRVLASFLVLSTHCAPGDSGPVCKQQPDVCAWLVVYSRLCFGLLSSSEHALPTCCNQQCAACTAGESCSLDVLSCVRMWLVCLFLMLLQSLVCHLLACILPDRLNPGAAIVAPVCWCGYD